MLTTALLIALFAACAACLALFCYLKSIRRRLEGLNEKARLIGADFSAYRTHMEARLEQSQHSTEEVKSRVDQTLAQLPPHQVYVDQYCKAPA